VAGALQDAICTTFRTRHNALHARAFVYENFRNFQIVNVSAIVVFSVSNGRFQAIFLAGEDAREYIRTDTRINAENIMMEGFLCEESPFYGPKKK
jgi:hypothetical protein